MIFHPFNHVGLRAIRLVKVPIGKGETVMVKKYKKDNKTTTDNLILWNQQRTTVLPTYLSEGDVISLSAFHKHATYVMNSIKIIICLL